MLIPLLVCIVMCTAASHNSEKVRKFVLDIEDTMEQLKATTKQLEESTSLNQNLTIQLEEHAVQIQQLNQAYADQKAELEQTKGKGISILHLCPCMRNYLAYIVQFCN